MDGAARWADEVRAIRAVLRDGDLAETFKWQGPCYTAHGGNVCILWQMRDGATVGFFKGVLFDDPRGLLAAPGENSQSMRKMRFAGVAEVAAEAGALRGFVAQGIAVEREGRQVVFDRSGPQPPEDLAAALAADPALAQALDALTPGRRRGWVLSVGGARRPETRAARIARALSEIAAGRGPNDR